ncbi:RNA-directed DNA polymerase, eukaryota, reverse transcriptase zinc-binding domain protein [Tanacetum coccineum]
MSGGSGNNIKETFTNEKANVKPNGFSGWRGENSYVRIVKGEVNPKCFEKTRPVVTLMRMLDYKGSYSNSLLCRVKEFTSLANLKITLSNEGFADFKIQSRCELLGPYWNCPRKKKMTMLQPSLAAILGFLTQKSGFLLEFQFEKRRQWVEVEGIPFKLWSGNTLIVMQIMGKYLPRRMMTRGNPASTPNDSTWKNQDRNAISKQCKFSKKSNDGGNDSISSGHFKASEIPRTGGSILGLLDEVVKVGMVMGYKMEGCMSNIAEIIEAQGADERVRSPTKRSRRLCGTVARKRPPAPDGFTSDLRHYRISDPHDICSVKILDGPFILNEVLQWCKTKAKQAMIFKVDFEKAFDSVRWDFLDDVLRKFEFGDTWCKWIQCCLKSLRGSILVNGSPTEEFQFGKASGLRINMNKSKIMGVHVDSERVNRAAMKLGCLVLKTPFTYLGSIVGASVVVLRAISEL